MNENKQKIEIIIKEKYCVSLLRKYLEQDGGGLNLGEHNQALLQIVIGRGGQKVIAYLNDEGTICVNGEPYGIDGFIPVSYEFIDMENIKPIGTCYFKGKMYKMVDQDNKMGVFVSMDFDSKKKEMVYTLMTTTMEKITGTTMVELDDDEIIAFGFESRKDYYKNK